MTIFPAETRRSASIYPPIVDASGDARKKVKAGASCRDLPGGSAHTDLIVGFSTQSAKLTHPPRVVDDDVLSCVTEEVYMGIRTEQQRQ